VSNVSAPAGWYPDPEVLGGQRYFDGWAWTPHRVPPVLPYPPPYWPWGRPPWKGARLGRPPHGPGALADPGRRLAARILDALTALPVLAAFVAIAVAIAAPRAGPLFPKPNPYPYGTTPLPGIFWIYLAILAAASATGLIWVLYETIATARYGRTLGKAWLHIRPVRTDGRSLGLGRAFGRIALYWVSGFLSWIGLLDPLWCVWDENRQCLHDKMVDTVVINDTTESVIGAPPNAVPPTTWPPA